MSRTYIGPFGRILPLPDGLEPEQIPRPPDELPRLSSNSHVPQPELIFGSDTTLGSPDPAVYITKSQGQSAQDRRSSATFQRGKKEQSMLASLFTPVEQADRSPALGISYARPRQSDIEATLALPIPNESKPILDRKFHNNYIVARLQTTSVDFSVGSGVQKQAPPIPCSSPPLELARHDGKSNARSVASFKNHHYPIAESASDNATRQMINSHGETEFTQSDPCFQDSLTDFDSQPAAREIRPAPKVIREDCLPGHGPVWVYEDGSVCPKIIDGESVNADWGITKAGKPRKRLALACTACREKKIKCDPAQPKCAQCEKFGRQCKYTTARVLHS